MIRSRHVVLLMSALLLAGGCQTTAQHRNSSVVDYLYPQSRDVQVSVETPRLTLPLTVGVAFTPSGYRDAAGLTEAKKQELLTRVSSHFEALDFVEAIEIIPSAYLRPQGSFENLDQLRRMFGIDVIALVSYDQTQFTDEGFASIAYWTIVGAYVVPGEKNATHTLLDAVVYDIPSRKLLFRAPGTSSVQSSATLVNREEQVREDAVAGFDDASAHLVDNLKAELEAFQVRIKDAPEEVQIARREGYQGSGSGGPWLLIVALLALGLLHRTRRG